MHRDLKPSNVKLTGEGQAKLLDFGLAKALVAEEAAADLSQSPTLTAEATRAGALLGTVPYMSPEQARGEAVDSRADIWAFGCVMFETICGNRAFRGATVSDTLAAILKEDPPWHALPDSTPPDLVRLIRWCLRKDEQRRLRHVGDARSLLEELRDESDTGAGPEAPGRRRYSKISWAAGLIAFAAGAAAMYFLGPRADSQPPQPTAASWSARPLTATGDAWNVALAPDGQTVAYLTMEGLVTHDVQGGSPNLVLHDSSWSLGSEDLRLGQPIGDPLWLHDGSAVAFGSVLDPSTFGASSVPRMGGAVTPRLVMTLIGGESGASLDSMPPEDFLVVRVLENRNAAPWIRWTDGDTTDGIEVPADILTLWDAAGSSTGEWVAYVGERADRTTVISTISRDSSRNNVLVEGGTELSKWAEISINRQWPDNRILRWPEGDHLYYRQISPRGADIWATRVDATSGRATGEPQLVYSGLPPGSSFDVAADGRRLVYSGGVIKTQIRVFQFDASKGGAPIAEHSLTKGTARHIAPRFSPDGQRVAYVRRTGGSENIYIVPAAGGEAEPVNALYDWNHISDLRWSPDGQSLAVYVLTSDGTGLIVVSLADSRVTEVAVQPMSSVSFSWSPDGRWIAYSTGGDKQYILHELATGEERELFKELQDEKILSLFSADGTRILVQHLAQGGPEIWLDHLDGEEATLIASSLHSYSAPVYWHPDGTIYLLERGGAILTVEATTGQVREFGRIGSRPAIHDGYSSIHVENGFLYLACAIDEPRESDVWVLDRVEDP